MHCLFERNRLLEFFRSRVGDTWNFTGIGPRRLAGLGLSQPTYWQLVMSFNVIQVLSMSTFRTDDPRTTPQNDPLKVRGRIERPY